MIRDDEITPFQVAVAEADVRDLQERLGRTRWGDDVDGAGWVRGTPVGYLKRLSEYWRNGFDWRAQEATLNSMTQYTTKIDQQVLHFIHVRSPEPAAIPILLLHGYPGSVVEFMRIIGPLVDPRKHGDDQETAFHVVAPSIPGFGFSTPLSTDGWDIAKSAEVFGTLMHRLGYPRYGIHGSDIGAGIASRLAATNPDRVIGMHLASDPGAVAATSEHMPLPSGLPAAAGERLAELRRDWDRQKGYLVLQSNRPQTLAHALTDSPVGQLSWIVDSFQEWTNPAADLPEDAVDRDQLLTNVSVYWFTRTGATAAQFLYATAHSDMDWVAASEVPQGWAIFNNDSVVRAVLDPARQAQHWSEFEQGGHFPAMEVPELLVADIRKFYGRSEP